MRKQRLELQVRQELLPLPLIIQEAVLLELEALELREAIIAEMTSNPLLDIDRYTDFQMITRKFQDLYEMVETPGELWELFEEEEERDRKEDFIVSYESPWEKLEIQIEAQFTSPEEKRIAYFILEHVDNFGYLEGSPEELSAKLGVSLNMFEEVRSIFIEFEPFGTGTRDFKEFIHLQLKEKGMDVPKEKVLEFLKENVKLRSRIIPYPFFQAEEEHVRYAIPEVFIREDEKGELALSFNDNIFPRLQLSNEYLLLLQEKSVDKATVKFLEEKYKRVQAFVENLKKRRDYLIKVGELIVEFQKDFLKGKSNKLVPVSQTEASKKLGIPISTLNRILKGKYADTPRGIYSLKFFFQKPFKKQGEFTRVTKDDIGEKIKAIIEKEDKKNPLSDEEIASILKSYGIEISRRTVTKFRNMLDIPDSRERKA